MSRRGRVRYFLKLARSILCHAEDVLLSDTEYLRDDINDLLRRVDELLTKMSYEDELLRVREALHADHTE